MTTPNRTKVRSDRTLLAAAPPPSMVPLRTYDFVTTANFGAAETISPIPFRDGSTLEAQFDTDTSFTNAVVMGTVTFDGRSLRLRLTDSEVNAIGTGVYRIIATVPGVQTIIANGSISCNNPFLDVDYRIENAVEVHVQAPLPHPVYDDMPSLTLLFENGMM